MERASSVMQGLAKDLGIESALALYRIKSEWVALFPGPLSLHSRPSGLKDGRLILSVDSSAWLQEINFLKRDIVFKLGRFGVTDIGLRPGRAGLERTPAAKGKRNSNPGG